MLAACTEQDADAAARGFFNWMLMLMLIGILAFVLWALIFAGGIVALIAGYRRLTRDRQPPPPQSMTPVATPPGESPSATPTASRPEGAPPLPAARPPDQKPAIDGLGIALVVFGGMLVLGASPIVIFDGDAGGIFNVSVPMPMLIVAGALIWFGLKRRRSS